MSLPVNEHRILVLDDNHAIHEDFRKILCPAGKADTDINSMMAAVFGKQLPKASSADFEIDFADQGQKGLALIERALAEGRPYAMAFVDIRMPPGWDGIETIAHLWKCDPNLQVVICTAYSDYSWQEIISKIGNSDQLVILKKPFDNIEVMQLAHAMTRKWAVTRQAATKLEDLDSLVRARTAELLSANANLAAEVAERATVQEALRRSEERFAKTFNFNPLPNAIIQNEGLVCVDANSAFLEALGATRDRVIGRNLLSVALFADGDLREELESGEPVSSRECKLRTASGALKTARMWTEPVDMEGVPHSLVIIEDVSAQQVVETRLRQAQKMESVGHLAAGIAHDFNNLITVISGHASLRLESKTLDPAAAASFRAVSDAAARASSLTRQLLAYSRKQVMQPKVIHIKGVFDDIAGMLRTLVPENIEIEYRLQDDLPPIYADASNVEQVIVNLVVNARDAMPNGGKLSIAAASITRDGEHAGDHHEARPGSFVRLTVEDTGNGISQSIRGKIFEPFFTTKPVGEGTGMGLPSAYGIIKQHNGWIEVAGQPGRGAIFHVFLPVTQPEPVESTPAAPTTDPVPVPNHSVRNILIVEDDPLVRDLASAVLIEGGFHVLEAPDGPTGLGVSRAFDGTIHLLLTDMVMPGGLSGKDVAERLAPERPDMKVIISSGYSFGLVGADMQLLPGQNFLPKPYLSRDLIAAVNRCLEGAPASTTN